MVSENWLTSPSSQLVDPSYVPTSHERYYGKSKYTEWFPGLKCASPLPALKYWFGFSRKVTFCPCQKLLPFVWLLEDRPQEQQKLLVRSCSHTNYYPDLSHSISVHKWLIELWKLRRKLGKVGLVLLLDGLCKWSWGWRKPQDIILLVAMSLGQWNVYILLYESMYIIIYI